MDRRRFIGTSAVCAAIVASTFGTALAASELQPIKQIELSPGHHPKPVHLVRASNGDYIVAGSSDWNHSAHYWAARFNAEGTKVWEYIEGGPSAWDTSDAKGQITEVKGIVDLDGGITLLCGRVVGASKLSTVVLDLKGEVIHSGDLEQLPEGLSQDVACAKWGTDVAVGTMTFNAGNHISWFGRIAVDGKSLWNKQGVDFYPDKELFPSGNEGFLVVSKESVVRIDSKTKEVSRYALPRYSSHISFARSIKPTSEVRVVYSDAPTNTTEVVDLDAKLQKSKSVGQVKDFATNRAINMADGSTALFGSIFESQAVAAVAVLSTNGKSRLIYMDMPHGSWVVDAVPADKSMEFAIVDTEQVTPEIKWISLK